MKPILLIHGYSSEGKNKSVKEIYGSLPEQLGKQFGDDKVLDLNLSRWISLSDGISLNDVTFALDRALRSNNADLLNSGFNVIIHSTGALVIRNWIKQYVTQPADCPIDHLVHLAGAHFGSGLAHIGKGQMARWGRLLAFQTGSGIQILDELMFGAWQSLDLALHFLKPGSDMFSDYGVQEFCLIGSQIPKSMRAVPVRYSKEDSSDNTVRTCAGNLNFNHVSVKPNASALKLSVGKTTKLVGQRLNNEKLAGSYYDVDLSNLSRARQQIPFAVAYETAHFGEKIGIVSGTKNRPVIMRLLKTALRTEHYVSSYQAAADKYDAETEKTFVSAAKLKDRILEWDVQKQYEAHGQLIFRIKDQFGKGVEHFDIMFKSRGGKGQRLEKLIEDKRANKNHAGTITFYLRGQCFEHNQWTNLFAELNGLDIEVTGTEIASSNIQYLPLKIGLTAKQVRSAVCLFQTTIIDIELARLPSQKVFKVSKG